MTNSLKDAARVCFGTARVHGRWIWPRAATLRVRHQDGAWLAFDDQGRVSALTVDNADLRGVSIC
jgi:hypothetical protein